MRHLVRIVQEQDAQSKVQAKVQGRVQGRGEGRPYRKGLSWALLTLVALMFGVLSGCAPRATGEAPEDPVVPVPSQDTVTVDLYFADDQAMEVLPERREVEVPADPAQRPPVEELVVTELLKGPNDPLLKKTLPAEAKLISIQVTDGLALVNFSKEFVTKHPGGSTGEIMTILSLVNSLTCLPNIDRVQILVEGQKIETIAGHATVSGELARKIRLGDFFVSEERSKALQERVDAGEETWRKDPLEVARREAPARGLLPNLDYELSRSKQGYQLVEVEYEDNIYVISLYQPETKGDAGIWVIDRISLLDE
ncbi:MAG: GerMN domain-containing protein [Bacillota bacterium]|jgi:hypothetical protein|nr:GerMN domain-containing protein [Candidatus Fermentithermobacillaceae bacterium]